MITNLGETSALDIYSRRITDKDCSKRWHNFLLLTRNQTRSLLPFETHNWKNSDNTADMETSSVETQATIVCSAMSDHCGNVQLEKRQRLHMSKHILLIDFLEDLDSDWEITTQYEYQHYVDESSGNFQHSIDVSEEIDDNMLSDIAMVPTDDEDECVIQAKKYADLLFTRCSRTLEYLETLKTNEWEIATLSDLSSNELSHQLESKTDHDMFHSENGSCLELSGQKTIGKITKRPKNTGFARSLDVEFHRVSVENDDLIIPSSSIESENENEDEPPICCHIKQKEDCSAQVGCANFNEENSVTDQNLATGTEAVSPDDPLGFQHLTWQESSSSSDASESAATSQWDVVNNDPTVSEFALQPITKGIRDYRPPNRKFTQQLASPVSTMPQALKKHGRFEANTAAISEAHTQGSERLAQMVNASPKANCIVSFENDQNNQTKDCGFQVTCEAFESRQISSPHSGTAAEQQGQANGVVTSIRKSTLKPARAGNPSPATTKESCTRKQKLSATTLPTSPKRVQFDMTPQVRYNAKLKGANALLRRTINNNVNRTSVTTTKVLAHKKAKKTKKKKNTIVLNSSSDSIESNITSILQNIRSSFDEANYTNENKIVKKKKTKIIKTSKESLTQIVKTSVRDVMKSILKSRRRRAFRRSAPLRKIVLKKMFVPKRKPSEDKAVQVFFSEDEPTNQIPVESEQKSASIKKYRYQCYNLPQGIGPKTSCHGEECKIVLKKLFVPKAKAQ